MVKVSHSKCRQCGQARHLNARFNLCGRCWAQRKEQLRAEWRDIKARRADKRTDGAVVEEESVVLVAQLPEEVPQLARISLTPEQEQEIVSLYTTTEVSVKEIAATYGIHETRPFQILDKNGVSWRRGDTAGRKLPPHIEAMKGVHVAAPTPIKSVASVAGVPVPQGQPMVQPEKYPTLTEALEVVIPREVAEAITDVSLPVWRVEFSGFREVRATSAKDAIAKAEELGALEVTLVKRLA